MDILGASAGTREREREKTAKRKRIRVQGITETDDDMHSKPNARTGKDARNRLRKQSK